MNEDLMNRIKARVVIRTQAESDELIEDIIQTVYDRLVLRVGIAGDFPALLESILVDVSVKYYRRVYYEGITQEGFGSNSVTFEDSLFDEYAEELEAWKNAFSDDENSTRKKVRFI